MAGEHFVQTQYGFEWGAAIVERHISDKGYVLLGIRTPKGELQVEVTPSGIIKAYITGHYEDDALRLRYPKLRAKD